MVRLSRLAPTHAVAGLAAIGLVLGLAPSAARATATEPNGLVIPRDSMNGETQLYTLFTNRGEPIDWIADGKTTPNSFSPRCGFGATYILNEAGSHFGLAWYNDKGTAPSAAELHVIVPANSPLGTTFSGADIIKDPAYGGGQIGFALIGGETHYSNPAYDNVCSACSPAGPWITAVIYQSKLSPNTYYLAFEDGATSASGWNNDGDFNDDVYTITGVTCSGSGAPCDTGKKGVCAKGTTSCVNGALTCVGLVSAGSKTCNGLDNDCDGVIDDGPCGVDEVCAQGRCTPKCNAGEFRCNAGLTCDSNGLCVEPACVGKTCPAGQACVAGACVDACTAVTCPYGKACQNGVCVDPCAGVTCSSDEVCEAGACKLKCDCAPCATGKTCLANGHCVANACATATCGAGTHCDPSSGGRVDDCTGAACPKGQECKAGACVAVATPDAGPDADDGGLVLDDANPFPDDTGAGDASADASADGGGGGGGGESSSSCGCATPGRVDAGLGLAAASMFAALSLARGARRRRDTKGGR
jgi:hypothetical protein